MEPLTPRAPSINQAILFDVQQWTQSSADHWLARHPDFKPIKPVHVTDRYLRYRLHEPDPNGKYYTNNIGKGIVLVGMYGK